MRMRARQYVAASHAPSPVTFAVWSPPRTLANCGTYAPHTQTRTWHNMLLLSVTQTIVDAPNSKKADLRRARCVCGLRAKGDVPGCSTACWHFHVQVWLCGNVPKPICTVKFRKQLCQLTSPARPALTTSRRSFFSQLGTGEPGAHLHGQRHRHRAHLPRAQGGFGTAGLCSSGAAGQRGCAAVGLRGSGAERQRAAGHGVSCAAWWRGGSGREGTYREGSSLQGAPDMQGPGRASTVARAWARATCVLGPVAIRYSTSRLR